MKENKKEVVWTPQQKDAIEARGVNLAVSAAAGSGKTAVLTERIVGLLSEENGVDAARLAVVTFTKKAAAELEEKLYRALAKKAYETKNPRLIRQLSRLGQARISTIHSLAFSLIREYKRHLDLPESIRIADENEADALLKSAIDHVLKEKMGVWKNSDETNLVSLFGTGNSKEPVLKAIFDLLKDSDSLERGLDTLWDRQKESLALLERVKKGEILFWDTPYGEEILSRIKNTISTAAEAFSQGIVALQGTLQLYDLYYEPFREFYFLLEKAKKALTEKDLKKTRLLLEEVCALSLPTVRKISDEERGIKDTCRSIFTTRGKDAIKKLLGDLFCDSDEEILDGWEKSLFFVEKVLEVADLAKERFVAEKREAGLLDYGDLEHLTLSLLVRYEEGQWVKTPLADRIREDFDAIFVDEYQDTNGVQDLLFRSLCPEGRLFVVGDPKQSIYRFRGAEPSIFSNYKNKLPLYKKGKKGMQKILLSNNFRCDKPIIDLTNFIFSRMLSGEKEDSLYRPEDHLRFSKSDDAENLPAELVLIQKRASEEEADLEEESAVEREARYLASRISRMLREEGFLPKEIAVLFRHGKQIPAVRDALEEIGIPTDAGGGDEWKEDEEFLFLSSLFAALENPMRDIPLLGALSSPVFRVDEDMAYHIRKRKSKTSFYNALLHVAKEEEGEVSLRCREILEEMSLLRKKEAGSTLSEFVFFLYQRWSLESLFYRPGRKSGVVKGHILSLCASLEATASPSVGALARRMADAPFQGKTEEKGGVQLMTIHASKGLEFPVVFVSFLSQPFNMRDEYATLLVSPKMGGTVSVPAASGRAKITPMVKRAHRLSLHREMLEEEMRILYVALTRAKRKLVLTATVKDQKSLAANLVFLPASSPKRLLHPLLETASHHLGLILPCLLEKRCFGEFLEGEVFSEEENFSVSFVETVPDGAAFFSEEEEKNEPNFDPEKVLAQIDFQYPHAEEIALPNKLSVSQLLRRDREEKAGEFYPIRLLDFEKGVLRTGAEKIGTATHQVMQFCDFAAMEKSPEEEFSRLGEKGFLSKEDLGLVDRKTLLSFFASPLYQDMKKSPAVEREKRFNVLLDGKTLGVGEGEVLVQGVVDAWFENPDGTLTLLDFKTDRVKEENGEALLRERHGDQLRLYAVAVEKMTGKKVSRLALYSFSLQREILL